MKITLPVSPDTHPVHRNKNLGRLTLMEVNQSVNKLLSPKGTLEPWQAPNVPWRHQTSISNHEVSRDTYEGSYQGSKTRATVTHNKKANTYVTTAQVFPADKTKPAITRSFLTDFTSPYPIKKSQTLQAASDEESRASLLSAVHNFPTGNLNADINQAVVGFRKLQKAVRSYQAGTLPRQSIPALNPVSIPRLRIRRLEKSTPQGSFRLKNPALKARLQRQ